MSTEKEDLKIVKDACARLMEHFDSVQILTTRDDHKIGTVNVSFGSGNYFSRIGLVRNWLLTEEEYSKEEVRGKGY